MGRLQMADSQLPGRDFLEFNFTPLCLVKCFTELHSFLFLFLFGFVFIPP